MGASANYASVPKVGVAVISTANTNRDGTGTIGTVFTAGASGSRIERIVIQATGTTTAGMVRLFLHDGTNARLYEEIAVLAITPSGTVTAFAFTIEAYSTPTYMPIVLPTGWSLRASTNNAETFNVIAIGGDL
jgi:hypothetical protein